MSLIFRPTDDGGIYYMSLIFRPTDDGGIYYMSLIFRPTDDGGIYYMSLYTMIRQLEDTGDVNLSAYSRNLAESGIILENSSSYANLHDALSFVIDVDFNRNSYSV